MGIAAQGCHLFLMPDVVQVLALRSLGRGNVPRGDYLAFLVAGQNGQFMAALSCPGMHSYPVHAQSLFGGEGFSGTPWFFAGEVRWFGLC
jgi:hypothetical protein